MKELSTYVEELLAKRDEAVKARAQKGLDAIWRRAREQYQGIDEVNRERRGNEIEAGETLDGPVRTTIAKVGNENRSTVFVNITRPYTNAGAGRIADLVLSTGKMPFELVLTPVSDIEVLRSALADYPQVASFLSLYPDLQMRVTMPDEAAKMAMQKAHTLIKDYLKETKWTDALRELINEAAQVGTGILKGPFPKRKKLDKDMENFLSMLPAEISSIFRLRLLYTPQSEIVRVENFYPAANCGNDIHKGEHVFECVRGLSSRVLTEYTEDDTYITEAIEACLEEGPLDTNGGKKAGKNPSYDLWLMTGLVKKDLYTLLDIPFEDSDRDSVFSSIVLCNRRIIKLAQYVLEDDCFPYDLFRWSSRENSWDGIGVPEQIETPQRGLNTCVRALQDNMGYSVGPQVVEWKGIIEPADNDFQMYPYKRWIAKIDGITSTIDDVKKALTFLEFPNYSQELMPIVQFWLKMAEDTSSLPLILQGQATTDAVGVSQQLQNNATTNLRLIIKSLDSVIESHVTKYYDWVQQYGPNEAKGDAKVEAIGSSVLIVKELQQQAIIQILDRALMPQYNLSPSALMAAFLEGNQMDAEKLKPSEEEKKQLQDAQQQPDPKVEAAQIEGEWQRYKADLDAQMKELKLFLDAQMHGLSIEQAKDAAELNSATQVAMEDMRQTGKKEEQAMKATEGTPAAKPTPEKMPEPTVDDALATLGLF